MTYFPIYKILMLLNLKLEWQYGIKQVKWIFKGNESNNNT